MKLSPNVLLDRRIIFVEGFYVEMMKAQIKLDHPSRNLENVNQKTANHLND